MERFGSWSGGDRILPCLVSYTIAVRGDMWDPLVAFSCVLSAFVVLSAVGGCEVRDKELIFVPVELGGCAYVVYDEPCGEVPDVEDGVRIIRVGERGVAVMQFAH